MITFILVFAFALVLFAGLYDLKTSNVHEEVPALLISVGLFYWLMKSFLAADLGLVWDSVISGLIFLVLAQMLYYAKVWGDGDAWIMAGLGFCLPNFSTEFLVSSFGAFSYPVYFLFNLFFVGGVYTIVYLFFYSAKHSQVRRDFMSELGRHRAIYGGAIAASVMASLFVPYFFLIGLIPILYAYAKVVERGMKKRISIKDLTEDHVIAGGNIRGVSEQELEQLKKTRKYVEVQDGIRFTMVFPLTLILLYFGGFFGILAEFLL